MDVNPYLSRDTLLCLHDILMTSTSQSLPYSYGPIKRLIFSHLFPKARLSHEN
jgi:hypothetical protein